MPKKVKDGNIGTSDGILLSNTSVLVEYIRTIRTMIMKMSKKSVSMQGQKSKQEELYQFIIGEKFCRSFEKILNVHAKHCNLQTDEEINHKKIWNKRTQLNNELIDAYYDISSEVDKIIQKPTDEDGKPTEE